MRTRLRLLLPRLLPSFLIPVSAVMVLAACSGCATPRSSRYSAETVESLEQQAKDAFAQKRWADAVELYAELEQRHPEDPEPPYFQGVALLRQERDLPAIEALQRSLDKKELPRTHYNLGLARLRRGELGDAVSQFEQAVALDPRSGEAWHGLAQAEERRGNMKEAAAAVLQAKKLIPDSMDVDALAFRIAQHIATPYPPAAVKLAAEGGAAMRQEKWDEARTAFEKALALAPKYGDVAYDLGKVYRKLAQPDRAEEAYRNAIALYGSSDAEARADAENNLADLLVAQNTKIAEAVALVREAIKVRGERPYTLDTLARACDAQGDSACAKNAFTKLVAFGHSVPAEVLAHAKERLKALP